MSRIARANIFKYDEIAIVHVMNRVVRRCFLMGFDALTGKDYEYRKQWIEEQMQRLAAHFSIDLLCFAVMSNHFHQVLRSRPDISTTWSKREVARRWLILCPKRKRKDGSACEPKESEIRAIIKDEKLVKELRNRLSDISWWMRLLCQRIAQRCNTEDEATGKFWENRFRAVRLLDEEAILACAAYVDLNPIRAAIAEDLEHSGHTSIELRLRDLVEDLEEARSVLADETGAQMPVDSVPIIPSTSATSIDAISNRQVEAVVQDPPVTLTAVTSSVRRNRASGFLAPLEIDERHDPLGPAPSSSNQRLSDKGFLNMPLTAYVEFLRWMARRLNAERKGQVFEEIAPLPKVLNYKAEVWYELVNQFGSLFSLVAGRPQSVDAQRERVRGNRFHMRRAARELLSA